MYVVRPQSFITVINILRNSALNTVETKESWLKYKIGMWYSEFEENE